MKTDFDKLMLIHFQYLPTAGGIHRTSDRERKQEATKTPATTVKTYKAQMGETVQVLPQSELCGRVAKRRPLLRNDHIHPNVCRRSIDEFSVIGPDDMLANTKSWPSPQTHHLHHEAWLVAASDSRDCCSAAGPGRLVRMEGSINKGKYCRILDDNLTGREVQLGRGFHFLQVNILNHTARATEIRQQGKCGVAMSMPN